MVLNRAEPVRHSNVNPPGDAGELVQKRPLIGWAAHMFQHRIGAGDVELPVYSRYNGNQLAAPVLLKFILSHSF